MITINSKIYEIKVVLFVKSLITNLQFTKIIELFQIINFLLFKLKLLKGEFNIQVQQLFGTKLCSKY